MAKSILIVDDSMSLRTTLGIALKGAGYEVVEAVDGKDGLSKLDGRKYNLIISDVNMPNMDGLSFVESGQKHVWLSFYPRADADHGRRLPPRWLKERLQVYGLG